MPPRKSLTRRFIHHLLLLSLARTILTVLGRGRAWDEWDERNYESQPAQQRGYRLRFAHTVSFCMLFFAGLALSAGAGNGVQSLLEADQSAPASADGTTGPTGPTGAAGRTAFQSAARGIEAQQQVAAAKPVAPATSVVAKTAVLSSRPTHAATLSAAAPSSATKKTAISKTHVARPAARPLQAGLEAEAEGAQGASRQGARARPGGQRLPGGDDLAEPGRSRPDSAGRQAQAPLRA